MAEDLNKLVSTTVENAFKNNAVTEGTISVTGSTSAGLNEKNYYVALSKVPDLISALFNGPTDTIFGSDPRPSAAWFKKGYIWLLGNNVPAGYVDYPVPFRISMTIIGATANIKLVYVQQFTDGLTLTATDLHYRILDYSVF